MPRNVKLAYANGTRSMDGRPGPKYSQNRSVHNIRMTVSPPNRTISGSEDIVYTNNGSKPLSALVIRLELNVHAPEAMRQREVTADQLTSDVQIDEFSENGKVKPWAPLIPGKGMTYNIIKLDTPLASGASVKLSFKWHYELVLESGREGVIDPTTFYVAYFYPRVAAYDDVNGWDNIQHTLTHEFFGDFNDYTLEVTVPKNYIVWATGDLTNADEVLQPAIAERLKRSFTSDDVVHVATLDEVKAGKVTQQNATNTWKWKAENVSDVAFGVSDHYIWDAGSLVVDKKTGRRASAQSAYDEPSKNFANMVPYIKTSLEFASEQWPGVPYPYSKMTVFRGFADMEYPMMANDSAQEDPKMQEFVAAHEIMHSYFPFFMGINERRYAFMEEGWTTAFEYLFNSATFDKGLADRLFKGFRVRGWITNLSSDADIPIMTPEDVLSGRGYGNNKYGRSALGYLAMKDLLGDAEFKRALHGFMDRWHGKHPTPWDMFFSFNNISGKDLNWFWKAWFFDYSYIDYAVADVSSGTDGSTVRIKNLGGAPAPVDVVVTFADGTSERLHQTPAIWQQNMKEASVKVASAKPIKSVELDGGIFMDYNEADNKWAAAN
ncbi:MAG: peptidase M1 [Acidobacteria bacterium OLB17]|nr:MAG: peptidase M1 [Acidobacteria bacterium OLB17]